MSLKYSRKRGVVAADHPLGAEAGAEMLRLGGNAFDAAVAASWMSFVANSSIASAGGGGYFLISPATGTTEVFDFFVDTPVKKPSALVPDFRPVEVDFGDKTQEFHIGLASAATPGAVAGLFEVHRQYGRLPMTAVAAPAIEAARTGVEINAQARYQMQILSPILLATEAGRSIYAPGGRLAEVGERIKMPHFADLLDYLARNGPEEFYLGEIAHRVARDCRDGGGYLDSEDFSSYRVHQRRPLSAAYREFTLDTMPSPNTGGGLLAFILGLLATVPLRPSDYGKRHHLESLLVAMQITAEARRDAGSPAAAGPAAIHEQIAPKVPEQYRNLFHNRISRPGNTVHISSADAEYNLASVTTSAGEGCGYFLPGTDVMLNNMLGEEDLLPQGFNRWRPGIRLGSMMAPSLLTRRGKPVMALGSAGSNRIRSAIVQTIMHHADFKLGYDDSVNRSRIHWEQGHLDVEPGFDRRVLESLPLKPNEKLVWWKDQNMYFGGVQAVFVDEEGGLHGAADRRRTGAVAVCE
jgi:gamma-glutamyltranspeptidase / glutathione hydrolase